MKLADAIKWIRAHKNTPFKIKFLKTDGTEREMACLYGHDDGTLVKNPFSRVKSPPDIVRVFDTDKKGYRSFREQSLLWIMTDPKTGTWEKIEK